MTDLTRIDDGPVATVCSSYRAGVPVALKVFPERADRRTMSAFRKEQAKLATVRRVTSILMVDGVEKLPSGEMALRMELCAHSLAALVDRVGPLPADDVTTLGQAMAKALAAAHNVGVVHGGISPTNVLFRDNDTPVVADFGVTLRQAFPRDPLHAIEYLPPETLKTGALNERTDLYGLGAVLQFALTARSPHPGRLGEQPSERVQRILREPVRAINRADVPVALATLIARLLATTPEHRPQLASQVADQLTALAPTPPPNPTDSWDDFDQPLPKPPEDPLDFDDFAIHTPSTPTPPPRSAPQTRSAPPTPPIPPIPSAPSARSAPSNPQTPPTPPAPSALPAPSTRSSPPASSKSLIPPRGPQRSPGPRPPVGPRVHAPQRPIPGPPRPAATPPSEAPTAQQLPPPKAPAPPRTAPPPAPPQAVPPPAPVSPSAARPAPPVAGSPAPPPTAPAPHASRDALPPVAQPAASASRPLAPTSTEAVPPKPAPPAAAQPSASVVRVSPARPAPSGVEGLTVDLGSVTRELGSSSGRLPLAVRPVSVAGRTVDLRSLVPLATVDLAAARRARGRAGRRGVRYDLLVVAVLVLALLVLVPLVVFRSTPADEQLAVTVELARPRDLTDKVRLSWTASRDLDFTVVVSAEGEAPRALLAERNHSMTVEVEPGTKYCFTIQASDGDRVYESEPQPLRGATCGS